MCSSRNKEEANMKRRELLALGAGAAAFVLSGRGPAFADLYQSAESLTLWIPKSAAP
jgi:shikimate kinase